MSYNSIDKLEPISLEEQSLSNEKYSTLWTEVGSEFDMIDELEDYELLTKEQLQNRCKETEKKCHYLEKRISELKNEKKVAEDASLDSYHKQQQMSQEIEELKDINDDLISEKKIREADTRRIKREHSAEIEKLEDSIEELQKNIKSLKKQFKEKVKEIEEDSEDSKEIVDLRKKLKDGHKLMKDKLDEIENLKETIFELENKFEVNQEIIKKLKETEDWKIKYDTLEKDNESLRKEHVLKQNIIDKLNKEKYEMCREKASLEESLSINMLEMERIQAELLNCGVSQKLKYPYWWTKHMI